jgi:hypothetical protein
LPWNHGDRGFCHKKHVLSPIIEHLSPKTNMSSLGVEGIFVSQRRNNIKTLKTRKNEKDIVRIARLAFSRHILRSKQRKVVST